MQRIGDCLTTHPGTWRSTQWATGSHPHGVHCGPREGFPPHTSESPSPPSPGPTLLQVLRVLSTEVASETGRRGSVGNRPGSHIGWPGLDHVTLETSGDAGERTWRNRSGGTGRVAGCVVRAETRGSEWASGTRPTCRQPWAPAWTLVKPGTEHRVPGEPPLAGLAQHPTGVHALDLWSALHTWPHGDFPTVTFPGGHSESRGLRAQVLGPVSLSVSHM